MRGIHAQNFQHVGEITQLFQSAFDRRIIGVAFDVCIELGGGEGTADHIAFQLGHVDAVGREAAHRLVQRCGNVADFEDECRHHPWAASRHVDVGSHQQKTGGVMVQILDPVRQYVQSVNFRRDSTCQHAVGAWGAGSQFFRSTCAVRRSVTPV